MYITSTFVCITSIHPACVHAPCMCSYMYSHIHCTQNQLLTYIVQKININTYRHRSNFTRNRSIGKKFGQIPAFLINYGYAGHLTFINPGLSLYTMKSRFHGTSEVCVCVRAFIQYMKLRCKYVCMHCVYTCNDVKRISPLIFFHLS